jgi:hypothetical protein
MGESPRDPSQRGLQVIVLAILRLSTDPIRDALRPPLLRSVGLAEGPLDQFSHGVLQAVEELICFSPGETTELIVRAAQAARLVILGPGSPPS